MKKRARETNPRKQTLVATLSQCSGPSLIKHLASCNPTVRSQSLRLLQTWLSATTETSAVVSDADMKKLWKGLFYCLWHCDKAPAQAELINRLAYLLVSLSPPLAVHYFSTFVLTLRREWNGIDHLRLDKFYLLIRRFIKSLFVLVLRYNWDLDYLGKFMDILEFNAFLADDKVLGSGVNYHVVSVFLDELKGCHVPARKEVVDLLFRPFFGVMGRSLDKVLVGKVKNLVFEELLMKGKNLLDSKTSGVMDRKDAYDDVAFGLIAIRMGLSGRLYEVGSSADCVQGNRKVVLKLHEEFLKLEKRLESSGIEIAIPEVDDVDNEDDEEVPELVPIESSEKKEVALEQTEVNLNECDAIANGKVEESENILEDEENARKTKKARKGSDGSNKKAKKKIKKDTNNKALDEEASGVSGSAPVDRNSVKQDSSSSEPESDSNIINGSVISNLQMQFEKVAADFGADDDDDDDDFNLSDALVAINHKSPKKRKRAKSTDQEVPNILDLVSQVDDGVNAGKSADKSAKKVRFAMKNNLAWKPHSPLPPQSVRIPPSVTPRGSALKKGVPPGPIREWPPVKKRLKQKKKGRKIPKGVSLL